MITTSTNAYVVRFVEDNIRMHNHFLRFNVYFDHW